MSRIFLFGSGEHAAVILRWLHDDVGLRAPALHAILTPDDSARNPTTERVEGVEVQPLEAALDEIRDIDFIIIESDAYLGFLSVFFDRGLFNVFQGEQIVRRRSNAFRFLEHARSLYIGPNAPSGLEPMPLDYVRFAQPTVNADEFPRHKLLVVNSMPKSGTVWVMGILESAVPLKANVQIGLSHMRDIELDLLKPNTHGALTLVRDLRAVVVSWFHHMQRSDIQAGFFEPRYKDIRSFYFDFWLGFIVSSERYYYGRFEDWLNYVSARCIPIVRYEDLLTDAFSEIARVFNFWKIEADRERLRSIIEAYDFDSMPGTVRGQIGFTSQMVARGHLRKGDAHSWREELPSSVAGDIEARFGAFLKRVGYL